MASPQLEDGYTKIANELLEAIIGCYLSSYEKDVLLAIVRKTYGWGKKDDWVAACQLSDLTGIPRPHITRTVKKLQAKKIVTQTGNKIGVQKDYERWKVRWRKLPKQVTGVTQTGNKKLPEQVHTKEKKETIKRVPSLKKDGHPVQTKNMPFNTKSDDYEEGVVDYDGDGRVRDPIAERKAEDKELTARFNELVDWLIKHQGRNPLRTSRPKQIKALKKLLDMRVTGAEAQDIIRKEEASDFWRGKLEKPDYWTVVAVIQKRG